MIYLSGRNNKKFKGFGEFNEFNEFKGFNSQVTGSNDNGVNDSDMDWSTMFDSKTTFNPYTEQLIDLIGILKDVTEEDLQEQYGISMNEYYNPTQETIEKVSNRINGKHR